MKIPSFDEKKAEKERYIKNNIEKYKSQIIKGLNETMFNSMGVIVVKLTNIGEGYIQALNELIPDLEKAGWKTELSSTNYQYCEIFVSFTRRREK